MNLQMFKLDLQKEVEPEITLPTSTGSKKKQESSRKTSTFALLTTPIYVKAIYCQPAYLTYIRNITCKMPDWMKHKLESRLQEEHIKNLRYADDTIFMAGKEEEQRAS